MLFRKKTRNRRLERKEILDVKVRSSVRRQTVVRRVGIGLGSLFALVLGLFVAWRGIEWVLRETVYQNPAFALHQFEVQTDGEISIEQLRSWSGVKLRDNLLALDLARVQRDLEMVPAIESVRVERVLPHTLRVRVSERRPVARLIFAGKPTSSADTNALPSIYTVDAAGYFMFPIEAPQVIQPVGGSVAHLPVITGVPLSEIRPGRQTESPQVRAALQFLQSFQRSQMAGIVDVREIDVSEQGSLNVATAQSCSIVLGLDEFDLQLLRWRAVYDHGQRFNRNLAWMDLSVSNNVPARWLDPTVVPAPPARPPQPAANRRPHV